MFSSFSLFKIQITVEVSHLACALLRHKWMTLQLREDIIQSCICFINLVDLTGITEASCFPLKKRLQKFVCTV